MRSEASGSLSRAVVQRRYAEVLRSARRHAAGRRAPGVPRDRSADRLEIGAGWGGFAYQFKTLFPKTTYVVVDFPELFLFSASYLVTVFPEAKVRFGRRDSARSRSQRTSTSCSFPCRTSMPSSTRDRTCW